MHCGSRKGQQIFTNITCMLKKKQKKKKETYDIMQQLSEASDNRFQVINGNILTVDHNDILSKTSFRQDNDHPVHIIGNLPFNIASPLLLRWLHQRASQEALFSINNDIWLTLMFQKEVGDVRISDEYIETFINLSLENYRRCIHIKAWQAISHDTKLV